MFNPPYPTDQELKEEAKRERSRKAEKELAKRLFNAKTRLIGIDVEGLDRQVNEKKLRLDAQKHHDEIQASLFLKQNEAATELEKLIEKARRKLERDIDDFRHKYQKKEDRREFDLNDPNLLKNSIPYRRFGDDSRVSISSIQKFESEDPGGIKRREQMIQQRMWLLQQMIEHKKQEDDKKSAEVSYLEESKARDAKFNRIFTLENECKKRLNQKTAEFNKAMAESKKIREEEEYQKELEANQLEIFNNITSDFLTENPDVANSNFGEGKKIGYLFKGMNDNEKARFKLEQKAQLEELKARREAEKRLDKEWDDLADQFNRIIYLKDQENAKKNRDMLKKLQEDNIALGREQRKQREYMDKVVYGNNAPTEEYFDQFNRTVR